MSIIYSIAIYLYSALVWISSFFNEKAKSWVNAQKNWKKILLNSEKTNEHIIWIHCASAGEFEQAIPIINAIKKKKANYKIYVSFFSPSGFAMYKDSKQADYFFYFPLDTAANAKYVVDFLQAKYVIFIRNEIWLNVLSLLYQKKTPTYLVNANLKQRRNLLYRFYLDKTFPLFTKIFSTQDDGNTKLEQVVQNKNQIFSDKILTDFCRDSIVVILGSSWQEEEKMMARFFIKNNAKIKIIIAPHEYGDGKLEQLNSLFTSEEQSKSTIISSYSNYQFENTSAILFLDKKGLLKYAYRYASIAVIGGGFNSGTHNISEAAVYGIPILFGPNYTKFEDANDFIQLETAHSFKQYEAFEQQLLIYLNDEILRNCIKEKLDVYFDKHNNVAEAIVDDIIK
ncbi:MAG TPA: glycosyltransferase N-terminal domain-containing protein [Chitinophagales bacterium]|nr:glycosyltransferase N-terminal domain-containing protein [Chitinophagales bacterium]